MTRMLGSLLLAAAIAYAVFFVPLADKPLWDHLLDVWNTPVVQQKMRQAEKSVPTALPKKVGAAVDAARRAASKLPFANEPARPAPHPPSKEPPGNPNQEHHREQDRQSLDALVHKVHKSPKSAPP